MRLVPHSLSRRGRNQGIPVSRPTRVYAFSYSLRKPMNSRLCSSSPAKNCDYQVLSDIIPSFKRFHNPGVVGYSRLFRLDHAADDADHIRAAGKKFPINGGSSRRLNGKRRIAIWRQKNAIAR